MKMKQLTIRRKNKNLIEQHMYVIKNQFFQLLIS